MLNPDSARPPQKVSHQGDVSRINGVDTIVGFFPINPSKFVGIGVMETILKFRGIRSQMLCGGGINIPV